VKFFYSFRIWLTVTVPRSISAWMLRSYRRPLGLFLGLILIPLSIIIGVTYQSHTSLWRKQLLDNLQVSARLGAEIMSETFEETFGFQRMLVSSPGFAAAVVEGRSADVSGQIEKSLRFIRRVDAALVLNLKGEVIAAVPSRDDLTGENIAYDEPFQGSRKRQWAQYVSGVYLHEGEIIEKVVGLVMPITSSDGRVVGLLQVQHRIEQIKSWLQKLRVEPGGFLYVVDHLDRLVVFPYQLAAGEPMVVSDWPPVAFSVSAEGGSLVFTNAKSGKRWLAAVHPVGDTGWRVVAVQRERAALKTLHRMFAILGSLVLILALLVGTVGMRWLKLHAFSLNLLKDNAKVMKELHQRRLLDRGKLPGSGEKGISS